jgi:hypothetical protein
MLGPILNLLSKFKEGIISTSSNFHYCSIATPNNVPNNGQFNDSFCNPSLGLATKATTCKGASQE